MLLEALPLLSQVVNDPLSKLPENIDATENAISAVTKICKYNHGNIAVDDVIPIWLSWLPILEDKEEAPHVYGYLCDLIQRYQRGTKFEMRHLYKVVINWVLFSVPA